MYRGRLWTMRQYAGFGTAAESNARYRYLLAQGVSGLSVAFDLPTQIGYDSDHAMAAGEVGRVGVAIDSIEDMAVLFDQIPLDRVSTSMTINSTAIILLALYVGVARRQGASLERLSGTIQNDVLKEYIARGTFIYPPRASLRIITDIFAWCERELPNWNTISISGYHIREAGSTAVQEVAFTLANGIAYVQAATDAGLDVDRFAPRLSFFFNAHSNFLEEVAKFRAARRLWARIMRERFGAKDERSLALRFHAQTGGSTLTAQQVIAEEAGITDSVDPLGGGWMVESLTAEIEERAEDLIGRIDERGGAVESIDFMRDRIGDAAYAWHRAMEVGERRIVGLNVQVEPEETDIDILRIDPLVERGQVDRLAALRAARDQTDVVARLDAVRSAARGTDNLLPPMHAALGAKATVGEVCGVLREEFGEYDRMIQGRG